MDILLDTNFVIACVRQKIDFFSRASEVIEDNIKWIVPFEVMAELEEISKRKGEKTVDKNAATIGLEMIKVISPTIVNVRNKNVDEGIRSYIEGKDIVLATLDRGLRKKIKNKILTINNEGLLEII
jgi:rRNA-processing protein FCF1